MDKIEKEELSKITGGATTINGPIINAVVNVINVLKDAGYALGSGVRRFYENDLCPLK